MTRPLAAALTGLIAAAATAGVPTYTDFEIQARSNIVDGFNLPTGSSFNSSTPALNDAAEVAFKLIVVGDTGNAGLWVGSRGTGSVVYDAPFDRLLEDPSINGAGEVAFEQFDVFTEGIYVYDPVAGSASLAVPPGGMFGFNVVSAAQINDTGVIGFRAQNFGGNLYMTDDDGTQTQYVSEATSPYGFLFTPSFDNANRIAGGFGDILAVIGAWGPCPPGPCTQDLSGNDSVDFADVLAVIAAWGPCP
ncbi:MAG: hypothetical protein GY715_09890 [Planctomycetes bacterium]|nr:hypothetical protein [Planctomycetota bacterium]